ncbi:uncharacterized protein F5147DRAFT_658155 [Suillus discolor]|uniref:Uncharacterized protein n=1 Tax=Suillus discolor TaxID=1912936 RepID=A0A9P7EUU7_9AGAM|nr:uncharacterized protein F5147DRAFT_658155 [Suillus discolor]KAG2090488.1 hypothetical protein F5147DRAFT_658155 [Suillus discolor]
MWAFRRLEGVLLMWLGLLECQAASHDYNTIMLLDSVTRDATKSHWTGLNPSDPKHMVVKREASASRQFIKYPWNQKMFDEAEKQWNEVGQWHCFMVNQVIFCIFNHPGSSMLANCKSHVSDHSSEKNNPYQCNYMICEGRTQAEIFQAQSKIQEFLVTTLGVFIQGEEKMLGHQDLENRLQQSSLRVSAQVDISIITDPESQKLHYFVTSIARGPGMMLYGSVNLLRPCTKGRTGSEGLGFSSCAVPLTRMTSGGSPRKSVGLPKEHGKVRKDYPDPDECEKLPEGCRKVPEELPEITMRFRPGTDMCNGYSG